MKNKIPDNVVFNEEEGYNASMLAYPTNVGAPVIKIDNILDWKSVGIRKVNKEYEWNEIIYNSKYSFEPVIGEVYHLYQSNDGSYFLSLIHPSQWNKEFIGSFMINSDKKWVHVTSTQDNF